MPAHISQTGNARPLSRPHPLLAAEPMDDDPALAGASDVPADGGLPDGSRLVRGDDGGMYLRWEPGMTTTTTTHTTTTVTHFPPLRLPLAPGPPVPDHSLASTSSFHVSLPSHLSLTAFPLADVPTPLDLQVFPLTVGGRKVLFTEDDPRGSAGSAAALEEKVRETWRREGEGKGWKRVRPVRVSSASASDEPAGAASSSAGTVANVGWDGLERVSLGAALGAFSRQPMIVTPPSPTYRSAPVSHEGAAGRSVKGKERAVGGSTFSPLSPPPTAATPPDHPHHPLQAQRGASGSGSSPPRKRPRDASERDMVVDPPTAGQEASPAPETSSTTSTTVVTHSHPAQAAGLAHQPTLGSGAELALLQSLPALLRSFDALPPKLADHFLMHCLRRSTLPTLQRVSAFISPALKFDFVVHFPPEISIAIFSFVGRPGLANAARVSRKWNEMVDCQRGVWVARLEDEGLWWGLGAEEEEEEKVRRRWEVRDRLDEAARREWEERLPGTPNESATTTAVNRPVPISALPSDATAQSTATTFEGPMSVDERRKRRSHPLKQVYRIRHMTRKNWTRPKPAGKRFMFHGHGAHVVTCLQFDTDKIVSASDDHSINVYAIKDGAPRCRLDGHEGGVWALQYRGDVLVSGSTDRTVRIWSIEKGIQTHVFWGHTSTVRCLQIVEPVRQPNGEFLPPYPLVVTGSRDSTIRVWRLPGKGEPEFRPADGDKGSNPYRPRNPDDPVPPHENPFHNHCLEGHTNAVRAIAAHGRYCVSGSYDCTVRVWDIVKGTCLHVLRGHQQKVYSVVLDTRRGRVASGSMDGTVKIWDLVYGVCLATLEGHVSLVGLLGISPKTLVSAAADSTIKVWDAATLECKQTLTAHVGAITCFQHDETKIISGSEGTLKMWDIRDGSFVRDIVTGVQGVWQVAFSGRYLVSASNRIGLTVFDVVDFGDCGWDDGAGDESLDAYITPEWERSNRLEPRQYQEDHEDPMTLDTFSSPTAGGSSVRRRRITSDDLSSPDQDGPWSTHPSALPPPPPPLAAAGLSSAGPSSSHHPPITPQRYSAPTAPHGPPGGMHHLAPHNAHTFSPSGFSAPPPAAITNASPSVDRKPSSSAASGPAFQAATSSSRLAGSALRSWEAEPPLVERDVKSNPISRRMLAGMDSSRNDRTGGSDAWLAQPSTDVGRKVLRRSRTEWRPSVKGDAAASAADRNASQEATMDDVDAGAGNHDLAGEDQPMSGDA